VGGGGEQGGECVLFLFVILGWGVSGLLDVFLVCVVGVGVCVGSVGGDLCCRFFRMVGVCLFFFFGRGCVVLGAVGFSTLFGCFVRLMFFVFWFGL